MAEGDALDTDRWRGKTSFAPGMPVDQADVPTLRYQALGGRVFTLRRWSDGSTDRGETDLEALADLRGKPVVMEGWYDEAGTFLGDDAGLEENT